MWPLDLYTIFGEPVLDSALVVSGHGGNLEAYRSLDPIVRVGVQFSATVLVAMVVLGMLQNVSTRAVTKSRRSPVISLCIGLPSLLIVGGLAGAGIIISDTSFGVFFAIPLVILGAMVLPTATVIGLSAIGTTIGSRLGTGRLSAGVVLGALLGGLAGLSLPATAALIGLAGALGFGAGIRVVFGGTGAAQPNERTVPPANKI